MVEEAKKGGGVMEACQRCEEEGEDRRTLWMACFYAMEELGIPFEECILFHADIQKLSKSKEPVSVEAGGQKFVLEPGKVKTTGELMPHSLFTLRVCKGCRADWLAAIKAWFQKVPDKASCGSGIFVRENGANVEITREEWDRRHP